MHLSGINLIYVMPKIATAFSHVAGEKGSTAKVKLKYMTKINAVAIFLALLYCATAKVMPK